MSRTLASPILPIPSNSPAGLPDDALSASISTASLRETVGSSVMAGIIAAIRLLVIKVPTSRPDNDCSVAEIWLVMFTTPRSGFPTGTKKHGSGLVIPGKGSTQRHLAWYGDVAV